MYFLLSPKVLGLQQLHAVRSNGSRGILPQLAMGVRCQQPLRIRPEQPFQRQPLLQRPACHCQRGTEPARDSDVFLQLYLFKPSRLGLVQCKRGDAFRFASILEKRGSQPFCKGDRPTLPRWKQHVPLADAGRGSDAQGCKDLGSLRLCQVCYMNEHNFCSFFFYLELKL